MDSGWAQFRVLYNFEPRDERDIAIQEGDIMIVAKPVMDMSGWLTGENTRTKDVGEFPGTYVEYIGDVEELPEPAKPPTPPPRPPRRRLTGGSNAPTRQESNGQCDSCCCLYNRVYCVLFSPELAEITSFLRSWPLREKSQLLFLHYPRLFVARSAERVQWNYSAIASL